MRCLVEMLAPYTALRGSAFLQSEASPQVVSAAKDKGRIYDPACGSGGMFVQSEKFAESHGGKLGDISIYGQDKWARRQRPFGLAMRARRVRLRRQQPKQSNASTHHLDVMNLALRGIEADFGPEHTVTFGFCDPLNRERRFIPMRLDDAPIKGSLAQFLYINLLPECRLFQLRDQDKTSQYP